MTQHRWRCDLSRVYNDYCIRCGIDRKKLLACNGATATWRTPEEQEKRRNAVRSLMDEIDSVSYNERIAAREEPFLHLVTDAKRKYTHVKDPVGFNPENANIYHRQYLSSTNHSWVGTTSNGSTTVDRNALCVNCGIPYAAVQFCCGPVVY